MINTKAGQKILLRRIRTAKEIADMIDKGKIRGSHQRAEEIRDAVKDMAKEYEEKFI